MFTRVVDFFYRLAPLSAFRKSREIAAGTGGLFFALNNIAKVPIKQFLFGLGPAISTAVVGLINFIYHIYHHYHTSDPKSSAIAIKKAEMDFSTKLILNKFNSNREKARNFLKEYSLNNEQIRKLSPHSDVSIEELNYILNELYNNTICFDFTKYTASTVLAIVNAGCHMMELMLLQAFYDLSVSDITSVVFVGLCIVLGVALINGALTFVEVKQYYENPPLSQQCDRILHLFDEYPDNNLFSDDPDFVTTSENAINLAF